MSYLYFAVFKIGATSKVFQAHRCSSRKMPTDLEDVRYLPFRFKARLLTSAAAGGISAPWKHHHSLIWSVYPKKPNWDKS
jgi:hypothetical protein